MAQAAQDLTVTSSRGPRLRVHDFVERSVANGPGVRAVLWVQGCSLRCVGCFNLATHSRRGGVWVQVDTLFRKIARVQNDIEGLTISGGEPLEQCRGLEALLRRVRQETQLSIILSTGYRWEEIATSPGRAALLPLLDVLIAGRYQDDRRIAHGLRGSSNKLVYFLTPRYCDEDLDAVPVAEVVVDADGAIVLSGVDPPPMLSCLECCDRVGSKERSRNEPGGTAERLGRRKPG